jgi:hypothetical protein
MQAMPTGRSPMSSVDDGGSPGLPLNDGARFVWFGA